MVACFQKNGLFSQNCQIYVYRDVCSIPHYSSDVCRVSHESLCIVPDVGNCVFSLFSLLVLLEVFH